MSSEKEMISLISCDGETFEIEEAVAAESLTIKHMIEDDCADDAIPIPNVTSRILAKVIEYCRKHVEASANPKSASGEGVDEELNKFDADFVKLDLDTLNHIILAANYLNIKNLLDLMNKTMADTIKDKSVEDVREIFGIENDFTPEEEAANRREYQWAFE